MAIYKVINKSGNYRTAQDVRNVINYVTSPEKVREDGVSGGAVLPEIAADAMEGVIPAFHNTEGLHLRHSVLSFDPKECLAPDDVKELAQKCLSFYKDKYQIISAVHEDREHLHIHLVMNTTNYTDGSKYPGTRKDYYDFLNYIDDLLTPYHIHVEPEK